MKTVWLSAGLHTGHRRSPVFKLPKDGVWVFCPAWATRCSDEGEICRATVSHYVCSFTPNFTLSGVGTPETVNFMKPANVVEAY